MRGLLRRGHTVQLPPFELPRPRLLLLLRRRGLWLLLSPRASTSLKQRRSKVVGLVLVRVAECGTCRDGRVASSAVCRGALLEALRWVQSAKQASLLAEGFRL